MPLTNSQYEAVMRGFEQRRMKHEKDLRLRLQAAYERFPRLAEIDDETASISLKKARISLGQSGDTDFDLSDELSKLSSERKTLLALAGFKDGKAVADYDCPLCGDTGICDGVACQCFKQEEIRYIYANSNLSGILEKENFDSFNLDLYSDKMIDPDSGLSARETAKRAYDYTRSFVENFPEKKDNICLSGKTGVGKTFLTHCIAKALIDKGFPVLYLTAFELFGIFEENTFRPNEENSENARLVFESELLIIDDLGTGINNSFISSALFHCINERLNSKKSTIISTNLSIAELRDTYSDRVTSRLTSGYQHIYLLGDDIRIKLKLMKGA